MRKAIFNDEIVKKGNEIIYQISATPIAQNYKKNPIMVYREYLNGKCECRYLYYNRLSGYTIGVVGENYKNLYYSFTQEFEDFRKCDRLNINATSAQKWSEIIKLFEDTEFKYLIKKIGIYNLRTVFDLLQKYSVSKYKTEIENLVQNNQIKLIFNPQIYKLPKEEKQKIIKFICDENIPDMSLRDIKYAIANNIRYCEVNNHRFAKGDNRLYKCIKNYDSNLYKDYINLCQRLDKNIEDEYWKYPKNLLEKHNQLSTELANKIAATEKEKDNEYNLKICKIAKHYKDLIIGDFKLYIPKNMEEIRKQAEILHQCLITCNYYEKMAKKDCILLFINKNEEAYATIEISPDGEIIQAYKNELDRKNCAVEQEIIDMCKQNYICKYWNKNYKQLGE